ncbi:hypothetical protein WICPIJ_001219 [Wickerhamomyces pijperi]|uniref:Uncharacterized protein n=1 Tax=Wickerhamomyces pijperi TaxID=599730 RepID=A0A9P8TQU2_WICPI|nr:hypothetical protein WICPIJ_001219 [Wickerhamomyces pijperi]
MEPMEFNKPNTGIRPKKEPRTMDHAFKPPSGKSEPSSNKAWFSDVNDSESSCVFGCVLTFFKIEVVELDVVDVGFNFSGLNDLWKPENCCCWLFEELVTSSSYTGISGVLLRSILSSSILKFDVFMVFLIFL